MSSLVINNNLSALNAYNNLNQTDGAMSQAISELSSGLQIQTAADNPAGYVISENLKAQSNGYQQAISNSQNGVSLIQTASGALNQIESILQTMNSLALSSANAATTDSAALSANQSEFSALQNEIDQIASTTKFGSQNLLDGGTFASAAGVTLQVGNDSTDVLTVQIKSAMAGALGVSSGGTSSVSIGTAQAASAAIAAIQTAIQTVATNEASIGATQNQLQALVSNLTVGQQNLQSAYSGLVDVNFAQETTQFQTDQILMQSGVAMLSQAQQTPGMVLKLLQ